ncbi:3'(2'),5'-bisphosphate nucleotidase CysQ [Mesorhizobium sp. LHD-90]|uniref:3'(2'),5'-bisphosphate nucleotidase CysQ n=1 Tax=Mesorhizobium sp. LHD-90 TaxID=3071414 RepID=UPI0027DF0785|nr:3'(2'),5'-bisphosphate nucleotidase CysQ [Mesorhizobium sp. LHD-90]MDQ6434149.1 3'(2'),5'-bisphosphate nucleotidase CysQ [Mesorhizobium sp. LHD-90]
MPVTPKTLIEIGLAAGREIMAVYADVTFGHRHKGDGSPVTEADHRAEAVILQALAAEAGDMPVVAEEEMSAGRMPAIEDRFFLVDPLDGTREFINRNGEFTVNIALIEKGFPAAGMIFAPALGQVFVAAGGMAWRAQVNHGVAEELKPIRTRPAPARIAATGSRSNCTDETFQWLKRFEVEEFTSRGSSLKFCQIACGEADIYPRFGRTMEWDTAAGDAILRAAGGITTTIGGIPLSYGNHNVSGGDDFANPSFVAFGDPALRDAAGERILRA